MHPMEHPQALHVQSRASHAFAQTRYCLAQFPGTGLWIALHSLQSKAHGFAKDYLDPGRGEHINALTVCESLCSPTRKVSIWVARPAGGVQWDGHFDDDCT